MNTAINDLLEHSFSIIKEKLGYDLNGYETIAASLDLIEVIKEVQYLEGVITGYGLLGKAEEPSKEAVSLNIMVGSLKDKNFANGIKIANLEAKINSATIVLNSSTGIDMTVVRKAIHILGT